MKTIRLLAGTLLVISGVLHVALYIKAPRWPFSKELRTTTDSWWPSTRGLCWNVFILMADEVAGLRTPDMDY